MRRAAGQANVGVAAPSRTLAQIVRANVFTRFNALLGAMFVVILIVGPLQDALFGIVLVFNTLIGIVQEWRAKRTLDRLAVRTAPACRVVTRRQRRCRSIAVMSCVDDVCRAAAPATKSWSTASCSPRDGLEIDESLLTGESDPVDKDAGDEVLSGSFVVAGSRAVSQATRRRRRRVRRRSWRPRPAVHAGALGAARRHQPDPARTCTWVIIPAAALLASASSPHNDSSRDAVSGSVAGIVAMVPEGLVLLTSIAFAVGAVTRSPASGVVVQELAAHRGARPRRRRAASTRPARSPTGRHRALELGASASTRPAPGRTRRLAALAAADPTPNATLAAVGRGVAAHPDGWRGRDDGAVLVGPQVERRVDFGDARHWVLGAPEIAARHASDRWRP